MKTASIAPLVLLAALCASGAALAAGSGGAADASADPAIEAAQAAIARKDWRAAQATLHKALATNAQNPDYHNLYAYALRKGPSPNMDQVFSHYSEALRIDPRHRGAHEYIGEAYLMVDNPAKAREHLAALDKLCRLRCEEYTDLKKSVAAYEASHKP